MVLINQLTTDAKTNVAERPTLERIAYEGNIGRARMSQLYNMFYKNGPGNGTMLSLPFDQLVEHGIGHMFKWERSADPRAVIELANRGTFSALALSIGQAEKYQNLIRPDLPLIVKIDGHFMVGKQVPYPRHSTMSSIERALEAGANAIGFTFYIGGEETEQDVERCARITEKAHKYGFPGGSLPEAMGADSLFWCAQGISAGESIGADVVKQKFPAPAKNLEEYRKNLSKIEDKKGYFYSKMPEIDELLKLEPEDPKNIPYELHVKRLSFMSKVAPNTLKIISGGPKSNDPKKDLIDTTAMVMDSGLEGRIVGRNLWGIPIIPRALDLNRAVIELMRKPVYARKLKEPRFNY